MPVMNYFLSKVSTNSSPLWWTTSSHPQEVYSCDALLTLMGIHQEFTTVMNYFLSWVSTRSSPLWCTTSPHGYPPEVHPCDELLPLVGIHQKNTPVMNFFLSWVSTRSSPLWWTTSLIIGSSSQMNYPLRHNHKLKSTCHLKMSSFIIIKSHLKDEFINFHQGPWRIVPTSSKARFAQWFPLSVCTTNAGPFFSSFFNRHNLPKQMHIYIKVDPEYIVILLEVHRRHLHNRYCSES